MDDFIDLNRYMFTLPTQIHSLLSWKENPSLVWAVNTCPLFVRMGLESKSIPKSTNGQIT